MAAKRKRKPEPIKKRILRPKRSRKARLTTEIPPELLNETRDLSAYLQGKGFDAPIAKLVERFMREGIASLKEEMGLTRIPKAKPRKALPGEESDGKILPEGKRVDPR